MATNRFNIPTLGFGLGLRATHYPYIFENWPDIGWFEIISENFMDSYGRARKNLEHIKGHYPFVMHGVSLSIGTIDPINSEYLKKLKDFISWLNPVWVSDHLCWTGVAHKNTHDLLPVPYTEEALKHIVARIREVQDFLERPLILENPSTYLEYMDSTMPEWEFIARMVEDADSGLLLDVNNVYVSSYNHRFNPQDYIDAMPMDRVVQIHLAGHTNKGTHIVDTHDDHVIDEVWQLYRYVINKAGFINTMVEWDDNIPEFSVINEELNKAKKAVETSDQYGVLPTFKNKIAPYISNTPTPYEVHQHRVQDAILLADAFDSKPDTWIRNKPDFPPGDQLNVYIKGYRYRLFDIVTDEYKALRYYIGDDEMDHLIKDYINNVPSAWYDAAKFITGFPDYIKKHKSCDEFSYELAVMETSISLLFHTEETSALKPEHISGFTPELLFEQVLQPRKALELFAFKYPVNSYYKSVMNEEEPAKSSPSNSYLAIYRHEDNIWRLELEESEYQLLEKLFSGLKIGEAVEQLVDENKIDEELLLKNLTKWFSRWMQNGLLANLD